MFAFVFGVFAGKILAFWGCAKKHMACRKKYKPCILKYKALISKYMPYIFREKSYLIFNNLQSRIFEASETLRVRHETKV